MVVPMFKIGSVVLYSSLVLVVTSVSLAQGPPAAPVRTGRVSFSKTLQHRLVVGQIEPQHRVIVAAEEAGRVTVPPPEPGSVVKAGAPLVSTDTTLIDLDIKASKAQIELVGAQRSERQALLKVAEREVARLKKLVADQAARQKALEDATDELAAARSRLAFVEALHIKSEIELERLLARRKMTNVVAPFDGTVVSKKTERGAWLDKGDPVVEFIATARVKVALSVPQSMVQYIKSDADVDIRVDAVGERFSGPPYRLVPDGDSKARTFRLLIKLDNASGKLKPGMSVNAYLPTGGEIEALSVPRDAVQTTPRGSVVFVVRGGKAVPVVVHVRFGVKGRFVVTGPLKANDVVVTEGNERLRPGQVVKDLEASGSKSVGPPKPATQSKAGS